MSDDQNCSRCGGRGVVVAPALLDSDVERVADAVHARVNEHKTRAENAEALVRKLMQLGPVLLWTKDKPTTEGYYWVWVEGADPFVEQYDGEFLNDLPAGTRFSRIPLPHTLGFK